MNRSIILSIFLFFSVCFDSYSQRPLSIKEVRPIVDSVQLEIDRLYALALAKERAFELQLDNVSNTHNIDNHLTYIEGDTVKVLLFDKHKNIISTVCYSKLKMNLLFVDSKTDTLTQEEQKLLLAKKNSIKILQKNKEVEIMNSSEIKTEFIFYPNNEGYSLYALTIPMIDSILPYGNDYLLLLDHTMKEKSLTKLSIRFRIFKHITKRNGQDNTLEFLSVPSHLKSDFSSMAANFWKFRRYHHNLRLDSIDMRVYLRTFIYYPEHNEIEIYLFPNERH